MHLSDLLEDKEYNVEYLHLGECVDERDPVFFWCAAFD